MTYYRSKSSRLLCSFCLVLLAAKVHAGEQPEVRPEPMETVSSEVVKQQLVQADRETVPDINRETDPEPANKRVPNREPVDEDNRAAVLTDGPVLAQWDIGLGLGYFNYRLYPGAVNENNFVIPAPYFVYRSPVFEIDRGIKSFIYHSEKIVLDISADFGLPVNSDDTKARKDMPDLDLVLQAGLSLEFLLNGRNNYFDSRFELPVRPVFSVSTTRVANIGYMFEPRFTFNHQREKQRGFTHKTTIGLKFATREFHAYYYDVAPRFATPDRPAYESEAGFGGSFVNYRISYRTERFVYWLIARYQSLRGATFEDSPLVLDKDYYFAGIGFSWIFASSEF